MRQLWRPIVGTIAPYDAGKPIEPEKFVAQIEAFLPPELLSRPPTAGP